RTGGASDDFGFFPDRASRADAGYFCFGDVARRSGRPGAGRPHGRAPWLAVRLPDCGGHRNCSWTFRVKAERAPETPALGSDSYMEVVERAGVCGHDDCGDMHHVFNG